MRKNALRRWAIYPYTDKELACVALRVEGIEPKEIGRRLMLTPTAVYNRLSRVYRKAGLTGADELAEWAQRNGMTALPPETAEDLQVPEVKVVRTKTRIKMGRLRRAMVKETLSNRVS
jgi:DNA-binding CsgD family transcriptional regulator